MVTLDLNMFHLSIVLLEHVLDYINMVIIRLLTGNYCLIILNDLSYTMLNGFHDNVLSS